MKIAIIGAGWAGLAAAIRLREHGRAPTVFESAAIPGGRARSVDDVNMGLIDNGQHLMVGAYTATLDLMNALRPETDEAALLNRLGLHLESADESFRMKAPNWPSPLHSLAALLGARGLTFHDRIGALRMMISLRLSGWRAPSLSTVEQLLKSHRQSERICRQLWIPLCLATLNTSPEQSCAQLFLNVLRDTLDAPSHHSDLLIPNTDLTALWSGVAADQLDMRYRHIVRNIAIDEDHVMVDSELFDACIIAIPPYAVKRVLHVTSNRDALTELLHMLDQFEYRAIATLTLQLSRTWHLPHPLLLLKEDHARGHYGQWVFERAHAKGPTQLAVVISDAQDFLKHDRDQFVRSIAEQIGEQIGRRMPSRYSPMPEIMHHRLIVEKRATFAAVTGLNRPRTKTAWPRMYLAGDWTDTGYPAVLEGAVRSGLQAADELLATL